MIHASCTRFIVNAWVKICGHGYSQSIPVLRPGGKKKDCSGNDRTPRASRLGIVRTEVDDVEGYALEGPTEETANVTFVRVKDEVYGRTLGRRVATNRSDRNRLSLRLYDDGQ